MAFLQKLRNWHEQRTLQRYAIPEPLWLAVLSHYPFVGQRSAHDLVELRRLASLFLSQKEFTGAQGLVVDDAMAVAIATQACLPVLKLGLAMYDSFVGIVVHPDEVMAQREVMDEDGVVHEYEEWLSGEAMAGGPLMLSWSDVEAAGESADDAYNVVIHEFAHVLDMRDGEADGVPLLAGGEAARKRWLAVFDPEMTRFVERVDAGEATLLDPYGAQAPEEFFAVATEAFFVCPQAFRDEHPALHELFIGYFRQDPAAALR